MNRALWLLALCCGPPLAAQQRVTIQPGQSIVIRSAAGRRTDTIPAPPPVRDTTYCTGTVCGSSRPGATATGIGVGPFNGTPGSLGTLFINANSPANLKTQLADAEAHGYKIFAAPCGGSHSQYNTAGAWSIAKVKACIDRYRPDSAVWRRYRENGVLVAATLVDEPQCSSCWFGKAIPFNSIGQLACYAKPVFGGAPIFTRSNTSTIPKGTTCLDGGILQFDASMGNVATWTAAQMAAAKAKGLIATGGVNAENGGKVVAGCLRSVTRPGQCRMSPAELTTNLTTLAKDSTVICGMTLWLGNASQWDTYTAKIDVKAALTALAGWGKTRSRPKRCGG